MTTRKRQAALTARRDANPLIVFDRDRRTYAGLATDGSYWHMIRPVQPDEQGVAGALACNCAAPPYRPCWRLQQAQIMEGTRPDPRNVPGQTTLMDALEGRSVE